MSVFYTESHLYLRIREEDSHTALVGLSRYAQDVLGDIVYVELPRVGTQFSPPDPIAVVESSKVASDICAPITGRIVSTNTTLSENPSLVNSSPEDQGWLFVMSVDDSSQLRLLMSSQQYEHFLSRL